MNKIKISKPFLAFILALTGVIMFSSKAVLVKSAYKYGIDALSLLTLRLLMALPVYLIILFSTSRTGHIKKIPGLDFLKVAFLGFIGYYLASFLDFYGLHYISASLERLILFIYPTLVLIISGVFLKKRVSVEQIFAVIITYFGVMLAFFKNDMPTGSNITFGGVLIFGSALFYAIYLVGSETLIPRFGTKLFISMAMTVSTISAITHFIITSDTNLWGFNKEVYILTAIMSVVSTIIPSFMIAEAIKLIGASNVAVIGSFGPVSTIILAVIFLDEKITPFQLLGTIVVISGILFIANGSFSLKTKQIAKKKT